MVSIILRLAPELNVSDVFIQNSFSNVLSDCHLEVEGARLHQSLEHLEDVFDLDKAQWLLSSLPLLCIMIPHEIP